MLGPPKSRRLDAPIAVSLDDLVPPDNFYRHLERSLDLGFVRDWARALYADGGRLSIDPVVHFRLQLIMFFEDIRSERKLSDWPRSSGARTPGRICTRGSPTASPAPKRGSGPGATWRACLSPYSARRLATTCWLTRRLGERCRRSKTVGMRR
jgi:hypothetical protein